MKFQNLVEFIKNPEIYKFFLVGLGGAIIILGLTLVFTSIFGIHYIISTVISFEFSMVWGFFANDKWTFSLVKKTSRPYLRFIKYNGFSLIGLGIIQVIMITLITYFGLHYTISQSVSIIVAFSFNFLMSKKFSFRN